MADESNKVKIKIDADGDGAVIQKGLVPLTRIHT